MAHRKYIGTTTRGIKGDNWAWNYGSLVVAEAEEIAAVLAAGRALGHVGRSVQMVSLSDGDQG